MNTHVITGTLACAIEAHVSCSEIQIRTDHVVGGRWEPADDVNTFSYGVSAKQGTVPLSKGFTYPRGYLPGFPEE